MRQEITFEYFISKLHESINLYILKVVEICFHFLDQFCRFEFHLDSASYLNRINQYLDLKIRNPLKHVIKENQSMFLLNYFHPKNRKLSFTKLQILNC